MSSLSWFVRQYFVVSVALIVAGVGANLYAQATASAPRPAAPLLPPQQLDDLVAPIALYPDPMLSQVLVA